MAAKLTVTAGLDLLTITPNIIADQAMCSQPNSVLKNSASDRESSHRGSGGDLISGGPKSSWSFSSTPWLST